MQSVNIQRDILLKILFVVLQKQQSFIIATISLLWSAYQFVNITTVLKKILLTI